MASFRRWLLPVCVLFSTGCQSFNPLAKLDNEQTYTAEEIPSIEDRQALGRQPKDLAESDFGRIQPVSNTEASRDSAANRIEQLISSGKAAIRQAGPEDQWQLQQAQQSFQQALNLDARNTSAHHGLAIVADLQENWVAAEHHYKQALQQNPNDADLLNDLGYSYLLQNKFYESSQYLNQAISIYPEHERAHINLALLSLKRGKNAQAQAILSRIYSGDEINSTLTQLQQEVQTPPSKAAPPGPQQWEFQQTAPARPIAGTLTEGDKPVHIFPSNMNRQTSPPHNQQNIPAPHQQMQPGYMTAQSVAPVGPGLPVGSFIPAPAPTINTQTGARQGGFVPSTRLQVQGASSAPQPGSELRNIGPASGFQSQPNSSLAGLNAGSGLPFPIAGPYSPPVETQNSLPATETQRQYQRMMAPQPRQFAPTQGYPNSGISSPAVDSMTAQLPVRTISSPADLRPVPGRGQDGAVGEATAMAPNATQAYHNYQQQLQQLQSQYYQQLQQLNANQPFPGNQPLQ